MRAVVWFIALLVVAWALGIRVPYSASVPLGIYWASPFHAQPVVHGSFVLLAASARSAPVALRESAFGMYGESLLKMVVGVPGDEIARVQDRVTINGVVLPYSRIFERDAQGLLLPRVRLPRRLGEDEVWLGSMHERGFDSRYFGPVTRASLKVAVPLCLF